MHAGVTNSFVNRQVDMAGGNPIRRSRVGAGRMGESDRGESAPRRRLDFYCANGHTTRLALNQMAERLVFLDQNPSVENLIREHQQGIRDHSYKLWALLMLELWHQVYMDGDLPKP